MVELSELLSDSTETTRNSTTGALDNSKRTRAINRTLQDLQDGMDLNFTKRIKEFDLISGINEYSLKDYVGATCLDNDGATSIGDFKNPYQLRKLEGSQAVWGRGNAKDVRLNVRNGRRINEYDVDNDTLIVNFASLSSVQAHECDSLNSNGTWVASGDATNLTLDEVVFKQGSGSLNFDVTAGTSLVLSNSGMSLLDLEDYENSSYLTVKVYLPTITNFTSIAARWGNDLTTNYWDKTETTVAGNQELRTGWNTFAFKWADATPTGTPLSASVDSIRFTITYSGATTDTDFRIDDVRFAQRMEMELEYFSLAMVQTSSDAYQLEFNPDSVTMTDKLLGGVKARLAVVKGTTYELFKIIGGKSERDRTDAFNEYDKKKLELLKKEGRRIGREATRLNFPGRH